MIQRPGPNGPQIFIGTASKSGEVVAVAVMSRTGDVPTSQVVDAVFVMVVSLARGDVEASLVFKNEERKKRRVKI